ncbi:MAG: indolepyruvate ferredoxin oxidoreductase subunit alpha [Eubacteriales bacterium]|nr:indolepyruvate ferredoxin oxidoreductase subunit alpha [Eubacteriales bacterium]MDD3882822.1 indolepyruvate ferredoxin oxidoreductase subunit alpha [Eubacteriales bacterium]MDD4513280.1 indolepyruvate ferredoxin oxidoreductase subunit alpha [Eubacteriales bacterium]
MRELLMGNEAIALGALKAGVRCVCGYPGTPSSEVLETAAKRNPGGVYIEWSVNEKAAVETAAGAAYAGARAMVTMKQVGLNASSDPIMCLNYIGVKGGLVILCADDPGPISSQTEQDTRAFGRYARIPVLDPSTPEEAFEMTGKAFELSEKYQTPVILRPTTRVCHSCAGIEVGALQKPVGGDGFTKDAKWVIFPRLSYQNKQKLFARETELGRYFSESGLNSVSGSGSKGIITGGVTAAYVKDALEMLGNPPVRLMTVGTPYPFPDDMAQNFLSGLDSALALEELDPVCEDALIAICGRKHLPTDILGKRTGDAITAGEYSVIAAACDIAAFLKLPFEIKPQEAAAVPPRPPVLCAGCPHRASFYAVKQAMKGKKTVFSGDIGCYTLGNAAPLDMVDTCLCMGAGLTIASGLSHVESGRTHFGFIGDSTFFHSGITGVVNALYNQADAVFVILDNHTTAMTGHQPHPGIGRTMMGEISEKISIDNTLRAIGVKSLRRVDPLRLSDAVKAVKDAADEKGVRVIIFESPCIALQKPSKSARVQTEGCIGCRKCISELGCPAISVSDGKALISAGLCTGCGLCAQVCPVKAISLCGKE